MRSKRKQEVIGARDACAYLNRKSLISDIRELLVKQLEFWCGST
jgi:hypothetical protein